MSPSDRTALLALPAALVAAAALAWAGSQEGATLDGAGVPLFAALVGVAIAVQWAAFVPAYRLGTEAFYDLVGSVTYLALVALAVGGGPALDGRSLLLAGMVTVWAARLGLFLFRRVIRAGGDRRFDDIKRSFPRFLMAWTVQGLWIVVTAGAALAAMTASHRRPLGVVAVVGVLVWLAGFTIEVVADRQKSRFRARPENEGEFVRTGLWARSRHPNYFGEVVLWTGVALVALPGLEGWQHATLVSPLFVYVLLTRISGIPILERQAEERWGGRADWEAYKARTPVLVPRLFES